MVGWKMMLLEILYPNHITSRFTTANVILFPFSHSLVSPSFSCISASVYAHAIYINNKCFSRKEITNLSTKRYKLWKGTRQFSKTSDSLFRFTLALCHSKCGRVCLCVRKSVCVWNSSQYC